MRCQYEPVRQIADGKTLYRCSRCGHEQASKHPADKVYRRCSPSPDGSPAPTATRAQTEVLYIIANHCQWCDFYNEPKQSCELCGCPSSKDASRYLSPRNRNCPAKKWTETTIQNHLHANPKKPT